jgi:peptide/nickel transport system ATP-binding protein
VSADPPLLEVREVVREYVLPRDQLWRPPRRLRALDRVSLSLEAGQSLGIVGESGCGKSTLARVVTALDTPTSGTVHLAGDDLFALPREALRRRRRDVQMVFQDPYGSLDPRQRVGRIVAEPLAGLAGRDDPARHDGPERRRRVAEALEAVGLAPEDARRYPHEFSGGQRQRIAIARAAILRPRLIVADEPVSALDVSVQAQVLNLMADLQDRLATTYLFISHDLSVVRHVCHQVCVMYRGRIVERGATATVLHAPAHPYTRALLDAIPLPDPARRRRRGRGRAAAAAETPADPPTAGCAYAPRCPHTQDLCWREPPPEIQVADGHTARCHFAGQV